MLLKTKLHILEDYHLIENSIIHAFVDRLLAQASPQLHLLLSTRSDPLISLARLRACGQGAEIRSHDLRFTLEETRTFLNEITQLDLPAERIQALVQETEGQAAALQLALASLGRRGGPVPHTSLEGSRGTNPHNFDYLSQEVLAPQPPEVGAFLLEPLILEQVSAGLCDAVLGIDDSGQILETLEAGNLFIVPLDDQRQWYRYHHLFRDFLQEQLHREQGDEVGSCTARRWPTLMPPAPFGAGRLVDCDDEDEVYVAGEADPLVGQLTWIGRVTDNEFFLVRISNGNGSAVDYTLYTDDIIGVEF